MLEEGQQYKDDPKAEYHNADGTAKSTTYLVTGVAEMPGGQLECAVQIAYYAENDLDAYDRSAGVIRRSLLGRSRKQDEIVTTRFQYFVAKPNRVDPMTVKQFSETFAVQNCLGLFWRWRNEQA